MELCPKLSTDRGQRATHSPQERHWLSWMGLPTRACARTSIPSGQLYEQIPHCTQRIASETTTPPTRASCRVIDFNFSVPGWPFALCGDLKSGGISPRGIILTPPRSVMGGTWVLPAHITRYVESSRQDSPAIPVSAIALVNQRASRFDSGKTVRGLSQPLAFRLHQVLIQFLEERLWALECPTGLQIARFPLPRGASRVVGECLVAAL